MDQGTERLIRRHNEQMRELIVRDIDALEEKLNVKRQVANLTDGAMDKVKGTLGMDDRRGEGWMGFIRHNALPLLAVGMGGSVLARNLSTRMDATGDEHGYESHRTSQRPYGASRLQLDEPRRRVPTTRSPLREENAQGWYGSEQESSGVSAGSIEGDDGGGRMASIADSASGAVDSVREQASRATDMVAEHVPDRQQLNRAARDHSQLVGFAALAAGALAGALLPRTQLEEEKLAPLQSRAVGKAADLVDNTVDAASETVHRAVDAVQSGAEAAKEEYQEQASDEPERSTDLPDLTVPNRITGSTVSGGGIKQDVPASRIGRIDDTNS